MDLHLGKQAEENMNKVYVIGYELVGTGKILMRVERAPGCTIKIYKLFFYFHS